MNAPQRDYTPPPHNLEVEQNLLGAVLLNAEAAFATAFEVEPEDFYEGFHGELWEMCRAAVLNGSRPDSVLIMSKLRGVEIMPGVTAQQYIASLVANASTSMGAVGYAASVRDYALRRRAVLIADEIKALAHDDREDNFRQQFDAKLGEIDTAVNGVRTSRKSLFTMGELVGDIIADTDAQAPHDEGATYGLADLDAKTGGMLAQNLVLIAGRPSMGKTAFAISVMRMSAAAGNAGLFISLEMSARRIGERAVTDYLHGGYSPIPYNAILRRQLDDQQKARVARSKESYFDNLPLLIEDAGGSTMDVIRAQARRAQRDLAAKGHKLRVVGVDYLQLIAPAARYAGQRTQEVTEISAGLKALAKDLDVTVLALSQLSRQVENRTDKRPMLSDLRESGALEQDADVVLFPFREAYYLQMRQRAGSLGPEDTERLTNLLNVVEIDVAKQRNGATGTVKVFADIACNAFRDLHWR